MQVAIKKKWCNRIIIDYFWRQHAARLLAFHMGMHARLGKDKKSSCRMLAGMRDCLEMISMEFWGGCVPVGGNNGFGSGSCKEGSSPLCFDPLCLDRHSGS